MSSLFVESMRRLFGGLAIVLLLGACSQDAGSREPEIYLIPEGYVGSFYILYNLPQGEPQRYENGARVYEIPPDGMLLMQSDANEGGPIAIDKIKFFYVRPDGSRTQITERWTTSLHDTPENRSDERVAIFGGGIGVFEPIRHCKVIETGFYVGTKAQAIDWEGGFDLFSERGLESISEEVFLDVCGS